MVAKRFCYVCAGLLCLALTVQGSSADMLVSSTGQTGQVLRFDESTGAPLGPLFPRDPEILVLGGMTLASNGFLYVTAHIPADWVFRYDGLTGAGRTHLVHYTNTSSAQFTGVALGPNGLLYVAAEKANVVLRFNATTGALVDTFLTGFSWPQQVGFGPDGMLYVCDLGHGAVRAFDPATGQPTCCGCGGVTRPIAFAWDGVGNLYVTCNESSVVRCDRAGGQTVFVPQFPFQGVREYTGLAFGRDGHLYVCDDRNHAILRFNGQSGAYMDTFVPAFSGGLEHPKVILFNNNGVTAAQRASWGGVKARYRPQRPATSQDK